MYPVTVDKAELIEKLKANRDQHRNYFLEAQVRYRDAVIEALDKRLKMIRDGGKIVTYFDLPEPQDFTAHYTNAIEALEWEVEDTVDLTEKQFAELVLNRWNWMQQFVGSTGNYVAVVE